LILVVQNAKIIYTELMFGAGSMLNILHVDMNAFYASCHQVIDPKLRGKPVLVAGDPKKRNGIILTASYEARKFGVKTAMPNWQAQKLCPRGIFVKPDYDLYVRFSSEVVEILERFTPLVEVFSIDEAWLDVRGCEGLFGDSVSIGKQIQQAITCELGLPCSVGISGNKLLAKMASDLKKPMGLTVIAPEDVPKILWPLPVDELFGVGKHMAEKLKKMNINTIGDLAQVPHSLLEGAFGLNGRYLSLSACGSPGHGWCQVHGAFDNPSERCDLMGRGGKGIALIGRKSRPEGSAGKLHGQDRYHHP
jgi:DNA polymerase-4